MKKNRNKDASESLPYAETQLNQTNERSDAQLVKAFVEGDAAAMETLIDRYRQSLFGGLMGMTSNRADAEDIYQEVWLRVIRNAERFRDISFKAWMWRIARNLVIDFRRKRKPDVSLDAVRDEDSQPLVERLVSPTDSPDQAVTRADLLARVMREVELLPEVQREVFLMRIQGSLPFAKIAETLQIPLNTALGRMHDAMNKLKRLLAEEA